jgi:hypothetical protein
MALMIIEVVRVAKSIAGLALLARSGGVADDEITKSRSSFDEEGWRTIKRDLQVILSDL